jgi:putative flippase GtrA
LARANARNQKEITRIVEYVVTGGAWFWSGYAMFALCYSVVGLDIVSSKIISYIFGLMVNFTLQRFWVFADSSSPKDAGRIGGRYVILAAVNLGIDTGIVWLLNRMGITPYLGQFVSAAFFTVWNYVWYKLWVFTRGKRPGVRRQAAPVLHRPKHVRVKPVSRRVRPKK